jgi:SAM-dependent methyltransferase
MIKIPKKSIVLLKKSIERDYQGISKNPTFGVNNQLNIKRVDNRLKKIRKLLPNKKLCQLKILEIGSGSGMQIAYLRKKGIKSFGIEPDSNSFKASQLLLKENKILPSIIKKGYGEKLPHKNSSFDLVISYQVLEHTKSPFKVFQESKRVLKNNGKIYFAFPNYHSFWEGHYAIPWFPYFNKKLAKIYVKILGKNPAFIDSLNFITVKKIKNICKKLNLEILDLGKSRFLQNMCSKKIQKHWSSNKKLLKIIKLARKIKITKMLAKLLLKLNMHYPIYLTVKKSTN